ncbi:MAG: transporter substrate-binding domain-containing protein, partial [Pseudomonadota bacterium]
MKTTHLLGAVAIAGFAAGAASAGTLDDVKAAGEMKCGVSTGLVGFAAPDANGVWNGFDVAVCRAVAAAVLNDPMAVKFVPTTGKTRFTALASGEVDMLARNTTWTFSRDVAGSQRGETGLTGGRHELDSHRIVQNRSGDSAA